MTAKFVESEAIVLAAGKQTRYDSPESKLMAYVDGRPAFFFTIETLLKVFPEEMISIISSLLFQDFNDYISRNFQKVTLKFDNHPGIGSAKTLETTMPWKDDLTFVTEGNIFYDSYLIRQLFQSMHGSQLAVASLGITPLVKVAPTHRKVILDPELDLTGQNETYTKYYRNMGVYVLRPMFQDHCGNFSDIIQVLNDINLKREVLLTCIYFGAYLHTATIQDILHWQKLFTNDTLAFASAKLFAYEKQL